MQAGVESRLVRGFVNDRIGGKEPLFIRRFSVGMIVGDDAIAFGRGGSGFGTGVFGRV